jgi:ABC-type antimicrobial peptide transport system permease subunit
MRRFVRQSWLNGLALILVLLILLAAILGELIAPYSPRKQNLANRLQPPQRHTGSARMTTGATSSAACSAARASLSRSPL